MKNTQICKYSIIRFQPYPETEEFANIGIVLYATATSRLEFRMLSSQQHKRITQFFNPVCKDIFVQTSKIFRAEIERIKDYLDRIPEKDIDLYAELIRSREDIIRFSHNRVLFSSDPVATVEQLFEHYVHRSFLHEPGYEEKMKRQVRNLLDKYDLGAKFKEGVIGTRNKYEVRFPFVSKDKASTVIKPIHFKHEKPSQLIDHGLFWLTKIQQLEKYRFIKPNEVLFVYDAPNAQQNNLFTTFNEIKQQIENEGIVMVDIDSQEDIVNFAHC